MNKNLVKALFAGLLLLCALVLAVTHYGELTHFLLLLSRVEPLWILVALLFQFGTYLALALLWRMALMYSNVRYPLGKLVPLAIAKLFADQALPTGGLSGIAYIVGALRENEVSAQVAMGVMLTSILSYYGAYLFVAAAAVALLWFQHDIHQWIVIVSIIFLLIAVAIPAGILFLKQWGGSRELPGWLLRMPLISGLLGVDTEASSTVFRNPRLLLGATLLQTAVFLLDTATLWAMLLAVGQQVSPLIAFSSFVIASMVAMLSLIPLGLGSFEASCVGLLVMLGIRLEAAFAATLLLRGFTLWLPMIPGLWLTRKAFR